jgi:transcriptional regulator with XRE-family HTH domain
VALRTADFSQERRELLGEAVRNQREADGFKFRPAFAAFAGISKRSLADLEQGKPGIGETNLRAVGKALSTWTEETPRIILEGGPIPPLSRPGSDVDRGPELAAVDIEPSRGEIATMSNERLFRIADRIREELGEDAEYEFLIVAREIRRRARRGEAAGQAQPEGAET